MIICSNNCLDVSNSLFNLLLIKKSYRDSPMKKFFLKMFIMLEISNMMSDVPKCAIVESAFRKVCIQYSETHNSETQNSETQYSDSQNSEVSKQRFSKQRFSSEKNSSKSLVKSREQSFIRFWHASLNCRSTIRRPSMVQSLTLAGA
uniref:Uncharacterized protein n=1 Tax=Romanomermis culicivorax TaxID=13658 RepID=A0A915J5S8_ROMCU